VDEESELLQDIVVFGVAVRGDDVHVDIYGSTEHVCGSIRFTFPERSERRRMVRLLERWCREETPLTFVANGSTIVLQNDAAVFGSQLETSQ
jgi:hypothetical protein